MIVKEARKELKVHNGTLFPEAYNAWVQLFLITLNLNTDPLQGFLLKSGRFPDLKIYQDLFLDFLSFNIEEKEV